MTEQTNQEGFEGIFEEAFAQSETTPEEQREQEQLEAEVEAVFDELDGEAEPETTPEERFTVKHNGQEHGLTREEMVAAAQKGMDYDRVREKLEEARGQIAQIDRLAKQNGLSRADMLRSAERAAAAEQFTRQGYDRKTANEMADIAVERDFYRRMAEGGARPEDEAARWIAGQVDGFSRRFPGVDPERLDPGAAEAIAAGLMKGDTPAEAYQGYLLRRQEKELRRLYQEQMNRERAMGSAKGAAVEPEDEFMKEFMKEHF